ncbi:dual specificity protein phosphatase family protein, partial [Pseudomonas gingeri]|nr:dual specificity protein phosphatase family protein [Pseudomonas gingeri]
LALGLVALNYALLGAQGFQKRADGSLSPAARWLFAPYRAGAWINSRLWTRSHPQPDQVVDNLWLGRLPSRRELQAGPFRAIVDLCAELPLAAQGRAYQSIPVLDLIAPSAEQCRQAALSIEALRQHGPLLVCCALGYSRSATALAAWLLHSGRAAEI